MHVVVAGQGYMGLPLAVRAAEVGHRVLGYDVDHHRVQRITAGHSYVEDVASTRLRAVPDSGASYATIDATAPAGFDIAVITVPTPLRDGVFDLTHVESCLHTVGGHLRPARPFEKTPKVVSGIDAPSLDMIKGFYDGLVRTTAPVSAPEVAEPTMLIENTFRHVNIALVTIWPCSPSLSA
ncbi:hypothetical protein [Streptomyces sp. NPDC003863]